MLGVFFSPLKNGGLVSELGEEGWVTHVWHLQQGTTVVRLFQLSLWLLIFLAWWLSYSILQPLLCFQRSKLPGFVNHLLETSPFLSHLTHCLNYPPKCCRLCVKGESGCFVCVPHRVYATVSCLVLLIWGQNSDSDLLIYSIISFVTFCDIRWKIFLFLKYSSF